MVADGRPRYLADGASGILCTAQQSNTKIIMHTRKQIGAGILALVLGLVLAGCSGGKKEVTVKFADCPAAVRNTIINHSEGVIFAEVDRETKADGRIIYEAKGQKADGSKIEVKVALDGRLVEFKSGSDD